MHTFDPDELFARGGERDLLNIKTTIHAQPEEYQTSAGADGDTGMVDANLYEDWLANGGWNATERVGDQVNDGGRDGR
jgi:hypothetical protein